MKRKENTLTKVEFEVMSALWDINQSACAWDILERLPEPRPAYTTVATYLKVLYEKGYVDFFKLKGEGKTHRYVARVTRAEYTRQAMNEAKKNLFGGSIKKMLCFFVEEEHLTTEEIQALLEEGTNSQN
ncbi:MAG: BlaI/MecI/CopY family transcriptional regulator [Bacteroidaceae bacterium]|nr:BlaI/MecI/CopY family transcriptional regulator [Bacteroidaceae bacterium]